VSRAPGPRPGAVLGALLARLGTPGGVLAALAAYAVLHAALRIGVSPAVTIDDARETVFGQSLAWGYQPRQPPLYNWLVWAGFQILGVGVPALAVVKYTVLGLAYLFVYLAGRRVVADPRLAALGALGLWLVVPVSWILHEALTHSVSVLAACAATFYVLLRLEASGRPGAYLALGAALGLGLLSKFSYAVFAAALGVAALTLPEFRRRLRSPWILLSLGVAGLLVAPYALWYARHGFAFLGMATGEVRAGAGESAAAGILAGLYYVGKVTVYYATPLWLVLLAVCPGAFRRAPAGAPPAGAGARLLVRFHLAVLGVLVAGALTTALTFLKFRWLIPGFFLLPLLGAWRLERAGAPEPALRRLLALALAAEALVVGGILLRVYTGSLGGRPYKLNEPYREIAARLVEAGFREGTIVAGPGPLGGNLRLALPRARVLSLESPYYLPPRAGGAGQCLVAWERGARGALPADLREFLAARLDVRLTGAETPAVVEGTFRHTRDHRRAVGYVLLPGAGSCR
jgi:4-amino-4-deoxy-L-arabinose transferase-like glycosyltransferase